VEAVVRQVNGRSPTDYTASTTGKNAISGPIQFIERFVRVWKAHDRPSVANDEQSGNPQCPPPVMPILLPQGFHDQEAGNRHAPAQAKSSKNQMDRAWRTPGSTAKGCSNF